MSTLDRHLFILFARNAVLVTVTTVVVFLVLDTLIEFQLLTRAAPSPWVKVELLLNRLPGLLNIALPVAALVSVLATVAPMLRRGEFVALGAAAMPLRRSTRAILAGCLLFGLADLVIADQVTPLATARHLALRDLLQGQARNGRVWRDEAGTTWFVANARLIGVQHPSLRRVVAATPRRMAIIDRLAWDGSGWVASEGAVVLDVEGGGQRLHQLGSGSLPDGLVLDKPPEELYRMLLPRYTMSSVELLDRGERADLVLVWSRVARAAVPLLAAMAAMAVFIRFRNRDRIAVAVIMATSGAAVPAGLIAMTSMSADTAPGPAWLAFSIGIAMAAAMPLVLWMRWRL